MRPAPLALLCLAACSGEDLARLDGRTPDLSEGESPVVELRHAVELRAEQGEVRMWVQRAFRNEGPDVLELDRSLVLPEDAVATSLRVQVAGRWQGAELLDAEAAEERWSALTLPGDAAPAPMAMLDWQHSGQVRLRYWPLGSGETATVEYEVAAPPRYEGGAWWLDYRHDGEALAAVPEFVGRVRPGSVDATFEDLLEDQGAPADGEPPLPAQVTATRVRLPRPAVDTVAARWATRSFGGELSPWGLELEVAARLAPAPVRPRVVFAVDASWTQGADGVALQRALVDGFLREAPDAEVEIVVFRRFATRLFGRFVPAAEVARALDALGPEAFALGNGSALDAAAALAAEALRGVSGPARLVLFTDGRLRHGLDAPLVSAALAALPPEVVVHVVDEDNPSDQALEEVRDVTATFAETAHGHGGVALSVWGRVTAPGQAEAVMRGLVRPVRIDDVQVEGLDFGGNVPDTLPEGFGLRLLGTAETAPATVVLRGRVWARSFEQVLTVDDDLHTRLAALAVGTDHVRGALTDDAVRAAALAARAVSPLTSLLSTAPDARPSVLGSEAGLGLYGSGCCGGFGDSWGTSSRCGGLGRVNPLTARPLVEAVAAACGAHGLEVDVENTEDEIVDVAARGADPAALACVVEGVWALRLPPEFKAISRRVRVAVP